jgi:hypothetical protein
MVPLFHTVLAAILGSGGSAAQAQQPRIPVQRYGANALVQARGGVNQTSRSAAKADKTLRADKTSLKNSNAAIKSNYTANKASTAIKANSAIKLNNSTSTARHETRKKTGVH